MCSLKHSFENMYVVFMFYYRDTRDPLSSELMQETERLREQVSENCATHAEPILQ